MHIYLSYSQAKLGINPSVRFPYDGHNTKINGLFPLISFLSTFHLNSIISLFYALVVAELDVKTGLWLLKALFHVSRNASEVDNSSFVMLWH